MVMNHQFHYLPRLVDNTVIRAQYNRILLTGVKPIEQRKIAKLDAALHIFRKYATHSWATIMHNESY